MPELRAKTPVHTEYGAASPSLGTRGRAGGNAASNEHAPDMMRVRKRTVEHPFGTLKQWMGLTHFLTRKLVGVCAEMSLNVLAYNMKRVMKIIGTEGLLKAMAA